MKKVAEAFADFALEYRDYDRLPPEVVRETKRILLNSAGITVGGIASDRAVSRSELRNGYSPWQQLFRHSSCFRV